MCLHLVIFPTYLSSRIWEFITTLFFILNPILVYVTPIIYWMGIEFTIICTFMVDLTRIIAWSVKDENDENYRYNHNKRTQSSSNNLMHALPEKLMMLSVIRLNSEFVGYLYKMGINFLGFMDSLYNTGMNTILICIMLGSDSVNTVQARINNYSSHMRRAHNWVFNSPTTSFEANTSGWTINKSLMEDPTFDWDSHKCA